MISPSLGIGCAWIRVVEDIGDSDAQTPSSSIIRNTLGNESPSSVLAVAVVRETVVWTWDSDKQAWLSISATNTFGPIWITVPRLATLDPLAMGDKASAPTANTKNITKSGNLFFISPQGSTGGSAF